MGKTQSKRSVDITTEPKKGPEEEVTGKLEKIEDIDQKQVNGDAATPQENNADAAEKKDPDESENDKDLTTEKSAETAQSATSAENTTTTNGDQNTTATAATVAADSSTKEEAAAKEGTPAAAEEISPLADESNKKSKKEKVKKKWSFRSISFGKKDKQKPAKTEETTNAENAAAATNGEAAAIEKTAAAGDGANESMKKDEAAGGDAGEAVKVVAENGDATEKELNGQKTPTPTEEKTIEVVANNESTTAAATTTTTTATTAESVPAVVSNETANETQTEKKVAVDEAVVSAANAVVDALAVVSNGAEEIKESVTAAVDDVSAAIVEKIKIIPSVPSDGSDGDKTPHQNGTDIAVVTTENGQIDDVDVEQTNKSQIEVKTYTNNTDNTSAANLATSTTTTSKSQSSSFTTTIELMLPAQDAGGEASKNVSDQDQDNKIAIVAADEQLIAATPAAEAPPAEVVAVQATVIAEGAQPAGADGDSQPPPPLPISPPPSQVSVFAFKDNSQVTEEMPAATAILLDDESTSDVAQPESDEKAEANEIVDTTEPEAMDLPPQSPTAAIIAKHIAAKSDEFIAATEVVDEITEKAVEILQQKHDEEPQAAEQEPADIVEQLVKENSVAEEDNTEHTPKEATPVPETEDEPNVETPPPTAGHDDEHVAATHVKNEIEIDDETVVELINTVAKDTIDLTITDVPKDIISQMTEITKNVAQAIFVEQKHDQVAAAGVNEEEEEDCSMNVVKEIEKLTLNDIDDAAKLSDISPTKEIANVKDLKENAAAAAEITTQDLPVTCE